MSTTAKDMMEGGAAGRAAVSASAVHHSIVSAMSTQTEQRLLLARSLMPISADDDKDRIPFVASLIDFAFVI